MDYPLLANDKVRTEYFSKKNGEKSPCIFYKHDDHWYILAKSLVKSVVEGHYVCGEDPYIQNILKMPPQDVIFFQIRDKEIIRKVWNTNSEIFDKVFFLKVRTLLDNIDKIFSDVDESDRLHAAKQVEAMMDGLT